MSQNEVGKKYTRPWGHYQTHAFGERYQIKEIVVNPGGKLSLQRHFKRSEHWVVVEGTAQVTVGKEVKQYHSDQAIHIPRKEIHRIFNHSKERCVFIEVQIGDYLGEDDIERLEDIYDR